MIRRSNPTSIMCIYILYLFQFKYPIFLCTCNESEKFLTGKRVLLFNLSYRHQGLIIRPESRQKIKGIGDLTKKGIRIINREYGSGTRFLLDHIFYKKGINPARIIGYNDEVFRSNVKAVPGYDIKDMGKMIH